MKKSFLLFAVLAVGAQTMLNAQAKKYWYSFNKDFTDSISGANEGVVTGDVTRVWDAERNSTVAVFNETGGEAGYVTLPAEIINSETISISCWAMHNNQVEVGFWGRFWDFGPDNQNYILLAYSEGNTLKPTVDTKEANAAGPRVQSPEPIVTGVWNHFVVTHGDGFTRLYMNGTEVHNQENLQSLVAMYNAGTCTNYLGKSHYNDAPLVGRLDDVIILPQVLSSEDVAKLYEGKLALATSKVELPEAAEVFADNGSIRVILNSDAKEGSINVFDIAGKSIFATTDLQKANTISVENAGIYFVKLVQGGNTTTTKVVLSK
jgi:hypothetical protein